MSPTPDEAALPLSAQPESAPELIYLDNGATSFPKPEEVYRFMDAFYRRCGVNPGRSGYDLCLESGDLVEETRRLLCDFFGGRHPERLVFAANATDALNLAIFGLLAPGDHVVTTHLEHNSSLRPLWQLQQRGVRVDWIDFDEHGTIDPDEAIARIRPETRAVVINHASNVLGTVQPVRPIGARCRELGIPLVLDVSQTAGAMPLDIEDLGAGVVCFTGHKSLQGPMGIGGMYVHESVELRRTRAGGTGVRSAQREHLEEYPYRMEYGTPNLPGIAGLNAGVKWVLKQGVADIQRREMELWTRLRDGLRAIEGVVLYCADDIAGRERISVLAFNVEGLEAADVGTMLDVDHGIACRTGLHCAPMVHEHLGTDRIHGSVRFGIGPLNTRDEIDKAVRAVGGIAAVARDR